MENISVGQDLSRKDKYEALIPQIESLVSGENDLIANTANIVAALKEVFGFFWIGLYFVKENNGKEELVLGPFQGPVACVRIARGKGVCGTAWDKGETILVDDVEKFPGHIACNALSRSEIVVPVFRKNKVVAVIDADSAELSDFDQTDKHYLNRIANIISEMI